MQEYRGGYRILIADGDANVHRSLSAYFKREGYDIISAYNGEEAIEHVRKSRPDIVILEIVLPEKDGLTVCREIRKGSDLPIIMLSTKGEEFDKLLGLELGADDYMTKPFSSRELLARIKAVLRRMHGTKREDSDSSRLTVDNLQIDMGAFIVRLNENVVPCTPKETEIIWTLASNPGMVFSRENLLQSIWGYDFIGDTRAVDSHIKRLRAKLCIEGNHWDIKTVWGVGYRFEICS